MSNRSHSQIWQGRIDREDGQWGRRWHQVVTQQTQNADLSIVGLACDLGVLANKGRPGAQNGPNAIRSSLANLAWHGDKGFYDFGNVEASQGLSLAQQDYATKIAEALGLHSKVVGLGGGHEIAWGSYQGLKTYLDKQKTGSKIGIINFDAHFDLRRPSPETSSGTPFFQIAEQCEKQSEPFHYACLGVSKTANTQALYQRADELNVCYLGDTEFCLDEAKAKLAGFLQSIDQLYLTVCLDVFNASIAPGVSAPAGLGIELKKVIELVHWIGDSRSKLDFEWRLADIAEMNPEFDIDNRTSKLAARLVFEIYHAMSE